MLSPSPAWGEERREEGRGIGEGAWGGGLGREVEEGGWGGGLGTIWQAGAMACFWPGSRPVGTAREIVACALLAYCAISVTAGAPAPAPVPALRHPPTPALTCSHESPPPNTPNRLHPAASTPNPPHPMGTTVECHALLHWVQFSWVWCLQSPLPAHNPPPPPPHTRPPPPAVRR